MGEKLVVKPINKGLVNNRLAFNIDNDAFPVLFNAYQWRGRIKRKRGTSLLNRLQRYFKSTSVSYNSGSTTITLDGSGNGNVLTGFSLQDNGNIVPGLVNTQFVDTTAGNTYTDNGDGTLTGAPGGSGTINYATGVINITGGAGHTVNAIFNYYPDLPVMGLEDVVLAADLFPGTLAFDTTYSYKIVTTAPYSIYDVSFYKNPTTASFSGYTQKTNVTPTSWNGQNYQQFWTVNYQGALWATNGITNPFTVTNVGMQFAPAADIAYVSNTATTIVVTIASSPLVVGDFVFFNEWTGTDGEKQINFQTGYVTLIVGPNITITLPNATLTPAGTFTPGIIQYLTNRSDVTKDCLRWYDGDPTDGNATNPTLNGHFGWVNFCPPLTTGQNPNFVIDDLPPAQYYLVGARMIFPFKDRLLFIGPVIQTSTAGSQVYLQDTVIYSQNGTPYYTASFAESSFNDVLSAATIFHPILTPVNQGASPASFIEDATGFGGFIPAGVAQPITSVGANEDVLIMGFSNKQARFIYTGNDVIPFNFFIINSEYGTGSTFSTITFDRGVDTIGERGIIITSQIASERTDLDIPDQVFQFNLTNNGPERVTAQRDYINEWVYFTYLSNQSIYTFPNQTLLYNYRDNSWGIFNECYTTYGQFRQVSGLTWATLPADLKWQNWTARWDSYPLTLLQPQVIGGNQQGFVLFRDSLDTSEGNSLEITNIQGEVTITGASQANPCILTANNSLVVGQQVLIKDVVGMTQLNNHVYTILAVTPTTITINVNSLAFSAYVSGGTAIPSVYSPNHCLEDGDYIVINNCIGTISSLVNGKIFSAENLANDLNNFFLNPAIVGTGTYFGGGTIQRMYVPFIQTKQFPVAWDMGRKTRIGPQQYLLTTTPNGRITLLIYLSQNSVTAFNYINFPLANGIVPDPSFNNSLIYSAVLYTCPESTNLGLTPSNTNLQMIVDVPSGNTQQSQIWHRVNTSLIGDTVQLAFTMSDSQMRDTNFTNQFSEIELHSMVIDVSPSQVLS